MEIITSKQNPKMRELRKLAKAKERQRQGRYLIEGEHLIEEAVQAEVEIEHIIVTEAYYHSKEKELNESLLIVTSEDVFNSLSSLPSPQGIMAVLPMKNIGLPSNATGKWLLLDEVQDPGNVGTLVRTADAAGCQGVIIGEGSADIYQPKVLRSMQGSHFHLPVISMALTQTIDWFHEHQVPVYGTALDETALPYYEVVRTNDLAIIMGNEGKGIRPELLAKTTKNLYIPMPGKAESLNVGVAAGIILFETIKK